MKRKIVSISMPPRMENWVREMVASGGFSSVSDYFRDLVKRDQSRRRVQTADIRTIESFRSIRHTASNRLPCEHGRVVKRRKNV